MAILLVGLAGCKGISRPQWFAPGTAEQQRLRAQHFDPYPDSDVGPNDLDARPLEYQAAPPEPTRARWNKLNWGGWGRRDNR